MPGLRAVAMLGVFLGVLGGCQREVYEIAPTGTRVRVPEVEEVQRSPARDRPRHRVIEVPSGDTIVLEDGRTVRYAGILAPLPGEPFFEESTQANREMVLGRDIVLVRSGEGLDSGGDLWRAFVLVEFDEDELLRRGHPRPPEGTAFIEASLSMIGSGSARVDPDPSVVGRIRLEYYLRLESQAKEARRGIWRR